MNQDYSKLLAIIRHPDNEVKHLPMILNTILLFQRKWYGTPSREDDWVYLNLCATINDEYDNLESRLKPNTI